MTLKLLILAYVRAFSRISIRRYRREYEVLQKKDDFEQVLQTEILCCSAQEFSYLHVSSVQAEDPHPSGKREDWYYMPEMVTSFIKKS